MPSITHLYRYPVKGMSPETLQQVSGAKQVNPLRWIAALH